MRILSLCSGIGGLDLGVHAALGGQCRTVCYVEGEAYAAACLVTRMQEGAMDRAPIWSDLKTFNAAPWRGSVDCIVGGYPCQPFSAAGRRKGAQDQRHLWPHIARHIRTIQPSFCFFENVPGHLSLGFEQVCQELCEMGYSIEAGVFSAAEVGAPHLRKRLFFLCYRKHELAAYVREKNVAQADSHRCAQGSGASSAKGERQGGLPQRLRYGAALPHAHGGAILDASQCAGEGEGHRTPLAACDGINGAVAHPNGMRQLQQSGKQPDQRRWVSDGGKNVADAKLSNGSHCRPYSCDAGSGWGLVQAERNANSVYLTSSGEAVAEASSQRRSERVTGPGGQRRWDGADGSSVQSGITYSWAVEPPLGRVATGISHRVDRLRALGNAVVPQTAALAWTTLMAQAMTTR